MYLYGRPVQLLIEVDVEEVEDQPVHGRAQAVTQTPDTWKWKVQVLDVQRYSYRQG